MIIMISFINEAATNRGWEIEKLLTTHPYLTKYSKGDIFFYSDGIVNIPINSQSEIIANNKVITTTILENENIPCIPTKEINVANKDSLYEDFQHFSFNNSNTVVIKPINGQKSEGVYSFNRFEELLKEINKLPKGRPYCISTYYPHKYEIRLILFKKEVQFYYMKPNNEQNILRPLVTKEISIEKDKIEHLMCISRKAASVLGYDYVSIDFLVGEENEKIIEVNLKPNLYAFIRQFPSNYKKCVTLYEKIFDYKEALLLTK
ncbi:hypothetical protein [Sutcliffiella cohnii]|uniref:ATP-grasp domain-containing protein n=1 Tax=Sutcliffiella cohnii TaxID=33932 RepID=UPI002E1C2856|nr:ATP-grasp domain-containing protein [Sutcliffiella cohnii]